MKWLPTRLGEFGEPRTWTFEGKVLHAMVHRHIHFEKDQWLLTCHHVQIERRLLENKDTVKALEEAADILRERIREMAQDLEDGKGTWIYRVAGG
jgi:hypothetical protein